MRYGRQNFRVRPKMQPDPLSHALALLKPRSAISVGLHLGGDWSLRFGGHEGIKFNAVISGTCWVMVESTGAWHHLEPGDCFLLSHGGPFRLASDPALPAIGAETVYRDQPGPVVIWQGGDGASLIGGRFGFETDAANLLTAALPPIVIVRRSAPEAPALQWCLAQLAGEVQANYPGGSLLSEHLAHIMLVHILRSHIVSGEPGHGWLAGLADARLSRAQAAMHADLAHAWTLEELAAIAGMSRSVFAERFRSVVGQSAMSYLGGWRMHVARDRLTRSKQAVATIGRAVGYVSEAAFSTAFRRANGESPAQYRRTLGGV
jgi:AraC-like DNA-binding protein